MPTYEYECETCGIHFDRFQHITDDPLTTCPECEGPVHRVPHPVGIVFKGSGFYCTDHRSGSASTAPPASKDEPAKSEESKPEKKKEEPKSEKKD